MIHLIIFAFFSFLGASCSFYDVKSQESIFDYHSPKSSKEEVPYLKEVDRPYTVIGSVSVNAERNQNLMDIIDRMREEAAILGGDAITNITTDSGTGTWAKIKPKNLFGNSHVRTNFNAQVIVFHEKNAQALK
jgi:hypothetical protein